jgi:hypothetical protein
MGACSFIEYVKADSICKNEKEAFKYAVDNALYQHGHNHYTGSIAEKNSFKLAGYILSEHFTSLVINDLLSKTYNDKWGPAGCLAVMDPYFTGREKTIKVSIEADDEQDALLKFYYQLPAFTGVTEKPIVELKKKAKTVYYVEETDKKTELRYFVGPDSYKTKSEAIKAAKEVIDRRIELFGEYSNVMEAIEQKKVEVDTGKSTMINVSGKKEGKSLYKVTAKVKSVNYQKSKVKGWYFFGIASY